MQSVDHKLKSTLVLFYGTQRCAARDFNIAEADLCRIVVGRRKPTRSELSRISVSLTRKIFQLEESVSAD